MGRTLDAYRQLFDTVRKGSIAPVYFLYGSEEYLRREFLRELITAALPERDRSFNLDIFYGDEFDRTRFDDCISSFPLFADRRVIIVKRFDALPLAGRDAVIDSCARVPRDTVLVVESDADRLDNARLKNMASAAGAVGTAFHCAQLDAVEAVARLKSRFHRDGCDITREALELLVESVGMRLIDLGNEADKLVLVAGENETITPEHVRLVVGRYRTENLFGVLDLLGQKTCAGVVAGVERLIDAGEEPVFILAMLQRRAAQMLELASLSASGHRSSRELAAHVQSGLRSFQVERLGRQIGAATPDRFEILLENLHWADRMVKSTTVPARTLISGALIAGFEGRTLAA